MGSVTKEEEAKPSSPPPTPPTPPPQSRFSQFFATRRKTKMVLIFLALLAVIAGIVTGVAVPVERNKHNAAAHKAYIAPSGMTLLVDNDLQGNASNKSAAILLGVSQYTPAALGCEALGETLWGANNTSPAADSIQSLLDYLVYVGQANSSSRFWIAPAGADGSSTAPSSSWRTIDAGGTISAFGSNSNDNSTLALPALCTQSAPYSTSSFVDNSSRWNVTVRAAADKPDNGANGLAEFVGHRDHNSFRFLGIHYAPRPERFTYSTPYWNRTLSQAVNSGTNVLTNTSSLPTVNATQFGAPCEQSGSPGSSEDCLYINVFTPYVPDQQNPDAALLRPVMFWIHGGALTGGSGGDPTTDGGNLASRGDVVVVSINYRLSTLGYLALNAANGSLNGNYGLGDQILALDWVRDNIAAFGGDPNRITIFGQSAGAGSVRAMMASPLAKGKFAAALPMSNLGGLNYGTTYSKYYTIDEEMGVAGNAIIQATNCTNGGANSTAANSTADAIVDCLRAVPAQTLVGLKTVARYIVVDGTYIVSDELPLGPVNTTSNNTAPSYALMMGTMRDDGAPFISFPPEVSTADDETSYLKSQGFADPSASLFPIPTGSANSTLELYNMSSRLATDAIFRCVDTATVYAGLQNGVFHSVYYYEFDRSYQTTGWPGTGVCQPPVTASHPNGDPSMPYFRCHSGELYYVFGNVARMGLPWRDDNDLPFSQYVLDSFAAFARTYSPNPDTNFLKARGFTSTLQAQKSAGSWQPSTSRDDTTVRLLDWPSSQSTFREQPQCDSLGLGLKYYLQ